MAIGCAAGPAFAQSLGGNEVFIGQTGETNTIRVDQDGNTNAVGGDPDALRLRQIGLANRIEIDQFGFGNAVAPSVREQAHPSLGFVQTGTAQSGNRNVLVVDQQSLLGEFGSNIVEAVRQISSELFDPLSLFAANRLEIRQFSPGGPAGSAQAVGQVVQINPSEAEFDGVTNGISITQMGDGSGIGNSILTAMQEGAGNLLTVMQSLSGNEIGTIQQTDSGNDAVLQQSLGTDNSILAVSQAGALNRIRLTQSGSQNFAANLVQDNQALAVSGDSVIGNRISLTLLGDDNGGSGTGGLGSFSLVPAGMGVFQASISQIGDDNDVSYVTTAASRINLFGFIQEGDGNGILGTLTGTANEVAVRQTGDDNNLDFRQEGDQNALAAVFVGERNHLSVAQFGTSNESFLTVTGDDNNALTTAFSGGLFAVASAFDLARGEIRQAGDLNHLTVALSGNSNVFAALQSGDLNVITATVTGDGNQAVVTQLGSSNVAAYIQTGNGNKVRISQ